MRLIRGLVLAALLATFFFAVPTGAASAKPRTPGAFTGLGFDTCVAPSDAVMDAWNLASPYAVVGIYTSGRSRYCDDSKQPYLSPAWVERQATKGWRFMPIHVGYQAPCFASSSPEKRRMSSRKATARAQARVDADEATRRAAYFGFSSGSVVYLDLEWYDRANRACDSAVMSFIDAFTERVHKSGYKVGLYSSGSAAILSVDLARQQQRKGFDFPDQMWLAWTNLKANTNGGPYLAASGWRSQRIHQFHNNVSQSFGGRSVLIDKNALDTGGGSKAVKDKRICGVAPTLKRYPRLGPGTRGNSVRLVQCLLKRSGQKLVVNGRWNRTTTRAHRAYRAQQGWSRTDKVTAAAWTGLLARGSTPLVLKRGKVGEPVYRLQRALRAAGQKVTVSGIYDATTAKAVVRYRAKRGLARYETAESRVWSELQHGRR